MERLLGLLCFGAAALSALVCLRPHGERSPSRRRSRRDREAAREAHYMRNFWNYDGGEQEEFEE